jgi:peptidyl-prolyl cis-trans isomerase C
MKSLYLTLLACLLAIAGCNKDADGTKAAPTETVATVNGKAIDKQEFDLYVTTVERQARRAITPEERTQLLDQFINLKLASEAATKAGVDKDPTVATQLEVARLNVLVDAALQKHIESQPVTDAELKPEYDAQVAQMPKEYHARHILVDDKTVAETITADLKKGADFAKLAQQKSKDSSSKEGGDLGWFSLESMVKPFSDAVAALQPGQMTDQPVQSQFGWHVIKLEDTRATAPPPFEQVKDQVKSMVERKRVQQYFEELRKNAKIEKTAAAAPAEPAAAEPVPAPAQ